MSFRITSFLIRITKCKVVKYFAQDIIYFSIVDSALYDSLISLHQNVYEVSDSQLEGLKRNKGKKNDNIEASRKHLEANYQSRIKILDERELEFQEEL